MWGLHCTCCLSLCFAPHAVYFYATDLAEHETTAPMAFGLICSTANIFLKYILLATFLPAVDPGVGFHLQDLIYAVVALVDIAFMWLALVRPPFRLHLSNEHKAQAVAIGWAFADSLVKRLVPILQSQSSEDYLQEVFVAAQSNFVLVWSVSFATVGALLWAKRTRGNRSGALLAALRVSLLLHALAPVALSKVERERPLSSSEALVAQLAMTAVAALTTTTMYACS